MTDPIAAIAEADAVGEIAAIFADIRTVYRVGAVNLVWRHLATLPGALPLVWSLVRPAYVDGSVARAASALRTGLVLPALPVLPDQVFAAAGLLPSDLGAIRAVLAGYHRTNAMALVALTAARQHLAGASRPPAAPPAGTPEQEPEVPLPRLLSLTDMAPEVAAVVLALNRIGADREQPLLASMYRHLAHWPPVLALSWTLLAPVPDLQAVTRSAMAAARHHAARLQLGTISGVPECGIASIDAAIARFTDDPIGRMTVLCAMLAKAFGATR